jgi:DNA-directed RNA polymerase specialized sigma24 family protein
LVSRFLDSAAFEALYERHESDVFNFCLRVLGSREAAATATMTAFLEVRREPGADLRAAARRETARLIRTPSENGAPATSPLPVREANARLPAAYREVLALRELLGCSYAEIGRVVGADRETVAELLWQGRLELRDQLKGTTLAAIAPVADSCRRSLALIAMDWDGEAHRAGDRDWLERHLRTCGKCRLSQEAAREASAAYRAWPPAAPPMGMRESLLATGSAERSAAGS